jgi:transposase
MIKMLKEGKTSVEIGSELCCPHAKVLYWKRRFEEGGLATLKTRKPPGRAPKVPRENLEEVRRILEESEWWTTKTVRELIYQNSGVRYSERQIQRLMHVWGYDLIRPGKRHVNKASKKEAESFKKSQRNPPGS